MCASGNVLPQIFAVCVENMVLFTLCMPASFTHKTFDQVGFSEAIKNDTKWKYLVNSVSVPLGAIVSGPLSRTLGCKRTEQFVALVVLASETLIWLSSEDWQIFLGLSGIGLAFGCAQVAVVCYIADISSMKLRGTFLGTTQVTIAAASLVQFYLSEYLQWKHVVLANAVLVIIATNFTILIPNAPRYLLNRKCPVRAQKNLVWLQGCNSLAIEPQKLNFSIGFCLVLLLAIANAFVEIVNVNHHGPHVLEESISLKECSPVLLLGLVNLFGCILCTVTLYKFGRRNLLLYSGCSALVCLLSAAIYCLLVQRNNIAQVDSIFLFGFVGYALFSNTGLRTLSWILIGELFANSKTQEIGIATSVALMHGFAAAFNYAFPYLQSYFTLYEIFFVCAGCNALALFVLYFVFPEAGEIGKDVNVPFKGGIDFSACIAQNEMYESCPPDLFVIPDGFSYKRFENVDHLNTTEL